MRLAIVVAVLVCAPALAFASDHKKSTTSKHASTSESTTTTSTKSSKREGTVTRHVEYVDGEQAPEPKHHSYSRAEINALKAEQMNRAAGHEPVREGWKMPVDKEPTWDEREKHKGVRSAPADDFDDPHGGSIHMNTDMNGNQMGTHL